MESNTMNIALGDRWHELRAQWPQLRIRNAAEQLGVSEAELLPHTEVKVTPLRAEFAAIFERLHELGYVMALSRNDAAVHERKGVYTNFSKAGPVVGLVVNEDIDLRIFFASWKYAFAVEEPAKNGPRYSLQFFANWGEAVHKIFLNAKSDEAAYHRLVNDFKDHHFSGVHEVLIKPEGEQRGTPTDADLKGFATEWENMRDTHDFYGMYRKYKLSRLQALECAPSGLAPDGLPYVKQTNKGIVERSLTRAAAEGFPIMVFIGNPGMIQIHTGAIKNLLWHGDWYNIMDKEFQMHLNMAEVASAWLVRKPTTDGMVQSIELFDKNENLIVQFFGARKPGKPELPEWKTLIEDAIKA